MESVSVSLPADLNTETKATLHRFPCLPEAKYRQKPVNRVVGEFRTSSARILRELWPASRSLERERRRALARLRSVELRRASFTLRFAPREGWWLGAELGGKCPDFGIFVANLQSCLN